MTQSGWTRIAGIWLAVVAVALCSGCNTASRSTPVAAFEQVDASLESNSYADTVKEANEFLTAYPDDPRVPAVMFAKGVALQMQGNCEAAIPVLRKVIADSPAFERQIETRFRLADCLYQTEAFEDALAVVNEIRGGGIILSGEEAYLDRARILKAEILAELGIYIEAAQEYLAVLDDSQNPKDRFDTHVRIGDLFREAGDFQKAFRHYNDAQAIDPNRFRLDLGPVFLKEAEVAIALRRPLDAVASLAEVIDDSDYGQLHEQAHSILDEFLINFGNEAQYVEMVQLTQGGRTGYKVHFGYVKLLEDYEKYEVALMELDKLQNIYKVLPSIVDVDRIQAFRSRIRGARDAATDTLGIILPLTGRFNLYANRMLRGAKLALEEHNALYADRPMTLQAVDSMGSPEDALQAMDKLIREDKVLGVIGPVLPDVIREVAPLANQFRIGMMLPATGAEGLTDLNDFIFRNCITNQSQVDRLVEYAANTLGHTRYGIMYPKGEYGEEMLAAFEKATEANGVELVVAAEYNPDQGDFRKGLGALKRAQIDALFLPDAPSRVSNIVGQMVYSEFPQVQLLGSNLWNSPDLLRRGAEYLEGAVFVDGFFAKSSNLETRNFVQKYYDTFQEDPDLFAAQTYDSVKIMLKARLAGAKSRVGLAEELYQIRDFMGATGRTAILPSGEADKSLAVLSVANGQIVQLN